MFLLCECRFLLVGQTMPTLLDEDFIKDGVEALSSRPFRNVSRQASRQMSICGTPEKSSYRQLSVSDRSSIRVEEIIPAARVAIQVRKCLMTSDNCVTPGFLIKSLPFIQVLAQAPFKNI